MTWAPLSLCLQLIGAHHVSTPMHLTLLLDELRIIGVCVCVRVRVCVFVCTPSN